MYLKKLELRGFKKFKNFTINFNKNENIIIGDNESGKSTILEALNIVLLQMYKTYDKYIVKELMNRDNIKIFETSKKIDDLPKIEIDLEFVLNDLPYSAMFCGTGHGKDKENRYGIIFTCEMDPQMIPELSEYITSGNIPYDFYKMTWNTYQGDSYNSIKKPLNFILIDNDNIDFNNSYNHYNKLLFNSNHSSLEQARIKNNFRKNISNMFSDLEFNQLTSNRKFSVNEKKLILENILTILDDDIPIQNKGKGKENLIKTSIALEKTSDKIDVIALEEPENHLSFTNLKKMLEEIKKYNKKQLIVTTHESMITSSLGLKNVIFISDEHAISFNDERIANDSKFFETSTLNNLLQFIVSKKVILVEGPTEYMLLPKIFEEIEKRKVLKKDLVKEELEKELDKIKSLEEQEINIISCNGVTYSRYLKIAELMKKKVLVLTDNDHNDDNIKKIKNTENLNIAMDSNKENWTWEVCFYNMNKEKFNKLITINKNKKYLYNNVEYEKVLGKMLNNKVDTAYSMLIENNFNYIIPGYIEKGLEWIVKD